MIVELFGESLLDVAAEAANEQRGFYPQTWWQAEPFASREWAGIFYVPEGWRSTPGVQLPRGQLPAAVYARAWLMNPALWPDRYIWTSDVDRDGRPVYVGMAAGQGTTPGFQVHRLLLPDHRWGVACEP